MLYAQTKTISGKKTAPATATQAQSSGGSCDCTIVPIRPRSCVPTCGQMSGKVVSMSQDQITLETVMSDKGKKQESFVLSPSLKGKLKVETGTHVTVGYNKTDKTAQSITIKSVQQD